LQSYSEEFRENKIIMRNLKIQNDVTETETETETSVVLCSLENF
jgi:hypothetical protein